LHSYSPRFKTQGMTDIQKNAEQVVPIKRALISVSDKGGIVEFAQKLHKYGVEILSTGGTAKVLKQADIPVIDVSDFTGFPEIMDGRVKTLHPAIHGGLLARRSDKSHMEQMAKNGLKPIDMLVINLYPFVKTVKNGQDYATCIENIDIGGPAMLRAAAKNHEFLTVITDPKDYETVLRDMVAHDGATTYFTRQQLAAHTFALTALYDSNISTWLADQLKPCMDYPRRMSFAGTRQQILRYGENPHQNAALYVSDTYVRPGVSTAKKIQGKELSYNNINDTNAAFELVSEFSDPAVAIIKHANPCGVAMGRDVLAAYDLALRCDPVSAFGGIIALNRTLTRALAEKIIQGFVEVIIAPSIEGGAIDVLSGKKNIRVLTTGEMPDLTQSRKMITPVSGGFLVQDTDIGAVCAAGLEIVTDRAPTEEERRDMLFAFRVAKHVKSNAIVYAKDGATVGIGAGQMSRIDSCRIAALKAKDAAEKAGFEESLAKDSVVASDAFFPFADGLLAAADAGVTAVIQPGGSIRDAEVIDAANARGLAMAFTGQRHFRH
jgi:phosphoribosylaminoimidazolecarboxamide formyltransferase/IMP cyclohydrolase